MEDASGIYTTKKKENKPEECRYQDLKHYTGVSVVKRRSCIVFSLCMTISRLPGRRCTAHQSLELPLHLANADPCQLRRHPGPAGSQRRSPLSCCLGCPVVPFCPPSTNAGMSLISRLSLTSVCHRRLLNSLLPLCVWPTSSSPANCSHEAASTVTLGLCLTTGQQSKTLSTKLLSLPPNAH